MPAGAFDGGGISALEMAATFAFTAAAIFAWSRRPGTRADDPLVGRRVARNMATNLLVVAALWAVESVWGFGGSLGAAAALLIAVGVVAVARRRSRSS
jgi:hypothetical protein